MDELKKIEVKGPGGKYVVTTTRAGERTSYTFTTTVTDPIGAVLSTVDFEYEADARRANEIAVEELEAGKTPA